ncbi:hypothetical protein HS088_TW14G00512 [Tripterygium wilfordii]|uniref:SLC12A transporter C-terminal domain-containing protein n=1 Tax=Tripterygium wilfordii TaxID=458696 RepID=A0A7J7CQK7_TRIWF|nr:hypothetical protein HS088_TW14G00512 [Tripterygium wilfordii]
MDNGDIEGGDDEFQSRVPGGLKYRPVVANDRAVLEMSSIDPGSSSSEIHQTSIKKIKVSGPANIDPDAREGSAPPNAGANGPHRESKLELFGFDSLVNILGLKSDHVLDLVVIHCCVSGPCKPNLLLSNQVNPKNWYPIPLVFCRPWGKLPENVPCHPKLADFANCMKKKGRGMSIIVSILDGDYHELAEDAKTAYKQLSTYIDYKRCEGVAEITMCLGNLKPNIVVMRYPEIWRRENLTEIPASFVNIIANKAVVIVKGLDEWPNEYQRQYGTIDLYWIVRDGGLMLLLSQLLLTKESFKSSKIQVLCIAEEDSDVEGLKADVKKFLYNLRMQAEVIVVTMKSWDVQVQAEGGSLPDDSALLITDC